MAEEPLSVVGVGNAIVDVLAHVDDAFLAAHGFEKGVMTLIDDAQAQAVYDGMGPAVEISGGSAANTIAGVASLGGRCGFVGRVRDDQLGEIFRHDVRALGVRFDTPSATTGPSTARCFVFVTPDAQRTMRTFLGACTELKPADIDRNLIAGAAVTYLEGYLWDAPDAKEALLLAARTARAAGRKVALSLSDPFCVDRHRDSFVDLVRDHVDILFANEAEIVSLYRADGFDEALRHARGACEVAALTRSEKGSVIVAGDAVHTVPAEPVAKVVDTTGAGDLYAAGFLHGYTTGRDLVASARIGGLCAAEVIGHLGARPETSLAELVRRAIG